MNTITGGKMRKGLNTAIAAVAALGLLAYASGCGTQASTDAQNLSQEKYAGIVVGMTADALKAIAGEPAKTEAKSMSGGHSMGNGSSGDSMNMEYWYYQGSKGWVRIELADNKVSSKSGY
ncbi:MAG: hypothetical protein JJD96_00075 [Thermoleophilia bacterium]|nr:hypothetical protein [Thermoleophilia bacterium]